MVSFIGNSRFEESAAKNELQVQQAQMQEQIKEADKVAFRGVTVALIGGLGCAYFNPYYGLGWTVFGLIGAVKKYAAIQMAQCKAHIGKSKERHFNLKKLELGIHTQIARLQQAEKKELGKTIKAIKNEWSQANTVVPQKARQSILHLSKYNPSRVKEKMLQILHTAQSALSESLQQEEVRNEKILERFSYYRQL